MDIALLQMAQTRINNTKQTEMTSSASNKQKSNSFDKVFNDTMSATQAPSQQKQTEPVEEATKEVTEVVEAETLEEVFAALGIVHDEGGMFAEIDGQLIPIEEMMNVEDLTAALGITTEELEAIIQQLLGEEMPMDDVWAILEQSPALLAQVSSVLQGENHSVTPKEATKIVEFLKLAQMIGMKSDTVYQQEFQLSQTKDVLQSLVAQLQLATQQETGKTTTFQQVVKQETGKTATSQQVAQQLSQTVVKQETDTAQVNGNQQTATVTTKTVTVTLPAERSAQSEALAKEIQNLLNRSQLSNNQGTMRLVLKLFPENLGQIRIELVQKDGLMHARLLATTAVGKELLDSNLNQLKSAFVAQNIQMERIDVAQSLQDAERNTRDQNFFNNFFRQQQEEQEEQKDNDEEKQSFSEFLTEEFFAEEV
ncbi:flagellar hook-length control protein FliK [Lysinibacillus sp. KU-BSD001]|uniref:flagellar hook-length control protein FliK n=1 Tax=Lysinibacillus sp. KU-BSD001 TaxID=3141328 RepID=UPI0036E28169